MPWNVVPIYKITLFCISECHNCSTHHRIFIVCSLTGAAFQGHIHSDKLVQPLVSAYVTTREVPLTVEMLQLMTSDRAVHVSDWVGQFVLSVLMFRKVRTEPEQLCELLKVHLLIMPLIIHAVRCIHKIAKSDHKLRRVSPSVRPHGASLEY